MPNALYQVLDHMAKSVTSNGITYEKQDDGRNEGIACEQLIVKQIVKNFPEIPQQVQKPRKWQDHEVMGHPGNIKATRGGKDNFSSAAAVAWVLTNQPKEACEKVNKTTLLEFLSEYMEETDRDYWILVYRKDLEEARIFFLKSLRYLISNPSNEPFQIDWNKEWDDTTPRSSSSELILKTLKDTHAKKRLKLQQQDIAARELFGKNAFN